MLQCIDLHKTYKPKKGQPVKALDGISLTFPDRGMVFLLGKSGSGKSTLLNVLGGLDRADSGDIIVRGTSTKDFRQSHFDSYRNTYIGFIFQEYNILEEFSVGANVALAIELQGRTATDEEINEILREVDLEGFGQRRPNELSGGQKQRVAIARALVKNPEIIFADEPTGALDSATGKQVFETLKKLSKDRLVVIVSHDREFAEGYADRIIELSDGRVIDDVSLKTADETAAREDSLVFEGNRILIPGGYHLTEEDRQQINAYVSGNEKVLEILASKGGKQAKFTLTDNDSIVSEKNTGFHLIKSKLPMKAAFRIGAGALRYKKVRLIFTVLLSVASFTLFALASTFASYNHIDACTDSLMDSHITNASVTLSERLKFENTDETYWSSKRFSEESIEALEKETGIRFIGMYTPDYYFNGSFKNHLGEYESQSVYTDAVASFAEINETLIDSLGYKILAGRLPRSLSGHEIAITAYELESFIQYGYVAEGETNPVRIATASDMIGKKLTFGNTEYTITGVIDTYFDASRYAFLYEEDEDEDSTADLILRYAAMSEFDQERRYGLCASLLVPEGFVEWFEEENKNEINIYVTCRQDREEGGSIWVYGSIARFNPSEDDRILWIDGPKETLADDEIILSAGSLNIYDAELGYHFYDFRIEEEADEALSILKKNNVLSMEVRYSGETIEQPMKVVGVLNDSEEVNVGYANFVYIPDSLYESAVALRGGYFSHALGALPKTRAEVHKFVSICYDETDGIKYPLQSNATFELDALNEVFKVISNVFIWIGVFFAAFAAILFSTFIAASVTYKKQEIGILRAIGSRSNDVFRIFFSESAIIAAGNFVLSSILSLVIVLVINQTIRGSGLLVTVLHFGPIQLLLLLGISFFVAAVASFLPVKKIASKRPVDAIKKN